MAAAFPRSLLAFIFVAFVGASSVQGENWPGWRGPTGDGVSADNKLPLEWSESSNIAWKLDVPGQGASSPVIWGDALFVTSQDGDNLLLHKLGIRKGKIEWTRKVGAGKTPRKADRGDQKFNDLHNLASPTPVTDGEVVIAHFGNGDLAAYDFDGKQLWQRNLQKDHGKYTIWWGHANSPVLYKDLVINVCMQDSLVDLGKEKASSYLVAHNKRTGERKWQTERKTAASSEECDSYTTPIFYKAKDRIEMIVAGANQLDAYDPATGKQLWYLPTPHRGRTITGPTLAEGVVYYAQGMRGPVLAVKAGGEGKLPDKAVRWKHTEGGTPDSSWPVVCNNLLFWVSEDGIAYCVDSRTGAVKWKERLSRNYKASPIAADGRVYFLDVDGLCTVVAAAPKFERLAKNKLGNNTLASLAVADGRIFLRSPKTLYCIGEK
jgi:outer membrane protein assembly factor BamB